MIIPVILCGGSGTRLWPLSRQSYPKQFLQLTSEQQQAGHSLLQQTLLRLNGLSELAPPILLCHEEHRFIVAEQLRQIELDNAQIVLEPEAKSTAPAATIAALLCEQMETIAGEEPVLLVLPSDHVIGDEQVFRQVLSHGVVSAQAGKLVTFGIQPTRADTGYGYIRTGQKQGAGFAVEAFIEKPEQATANTYIASGDYLWNSGMFLFTAQEWLSEVDQYAPEIRVVCQQALDVASSDLDFIRLDEDCFALSPSESIDTAVMEKTQRSEVIPLDAGWSDIGTYEALYDYAKQQRQLDSDENLVQGDVINHLSQGCYIKAQSRLVTTVGLSNCIVVETEDAVLVADKAQAPQFKSLINVLDTEQRHELEHPVRAHRPWGSYECLDERERAKVKRIEVKPGQQISLQIHHHRAEHWVVVSGVAKVECGENVLMLKENQSTFIPPATPHRLSNPGQIPLQLIEVQTGSYLGEDDIVRLADSYGRQYSDSAEKNPRDEEQTDSPVNQPNLSTKPFNPA